MCNLREGFVNLREGFVVAPWRLREAFSKTRSAKASRSPLEGFAKAPRAPPFGNDSSDNDKPPGCDCTDDVLEFPIRREKQLRNDSS